MDTAWDARSATREHSWEGQAAIEEVVATAIFKTTTEMMANFMAMLNECIAASMPHQELGDDSNATL